MTLKRPLTRMLLAASIAVVIGLPSIGSMGKSSPHEAQAADGLIGRAALPAAIFAPGPTSGTLLGDQPMSRVDVSQELGPQTLAEHGCIAYSVGVEEAGQRIGFEAGGRAMGVSCQAS